MDLIKDTFSFDEFLEKLKDKENFNASVLALFEDLDMIELRVRDNEKVVYMLQITKAEPILDVKIDRCKHATAKFETIEGTFKLDSTLGVILKELQKKVHEILDDMDDEYLDTY